MWKAFWQASARYLHRWLRVQFHNNPLVTKPGPYLKQVALALQIGLLGAVICIAVGIIGSAFFVIGVIRGWF